MRDFKHIYKPTNSCAILRITSASCERLFLNIFGLKNYFCSNFLLVLICSSHLESSLLFCVTYRISLNRVLKLLRLTFLSTTERISIWQLPMECPSPIH